MKWRNVRGAVIVENHIQITIVINSAYHVINYSLQSGPRGAIYCQYAFFAVKPSDIITAPGSSATPVAAMAIENA